MRLKSKHILAGLAAAGLLAGAMAGAATSANAATPSCGSGCTDLFSHQFGDFADPAFVMDSFKQGDVTGTPVILFRTSNSDPAEDFTVDQQGLTSEFLAAGLVSSALALHYGCTDIVFGACAPSAANPVDTGAGYDFEAYEFMYSPFGVQTGLCTGVAVTAAAGTKVTLQPCGLSGKTIWIAADTEHYYKKGNPNAKPPVPAVSYNFGTGLQNFAQPLVNGSDTNFSQPFGLTYPNSSYPTDTPRPQLYTANLLGFSLGFTSGDPDPGSINSNQLWSADAGILP
jgi:hypothetical protein